MADAVSERRWCSKDALGMMTLNIFPGRQTLTILTFHRVLAQPHPLYPEWPTQKEFQRKLRWLKSCAEIVPLAEGLARVRSERGARHLAAITFDDGYKDNLDLALPVLESEKINATFFVTTRYLEGRLLFDDLVVRAFTETRHKYFGDLRLDLPEKSIESIQQRRRASDHVLEFLKYLRPLERDLIAVDIADRLALEDRSSSMLSADGVRALRDAGMEVGSHSHEHPISSTVSDAEFFADTSESFNQLERILSKRPRFFAFPNGIVGKDFSPRHSDMVRQLGFEAAFSTTSGVVRSDSDLYALPRMTPWPSRRLRLIAQILVAQQLG
jgi:peptidoglycan/xylan/chitin deacetylase (PgdA/CDA1 family)